MNVIGLSFDFHDATAALVRDGTIVGVAAEERYSLNKHDHNYPLLAIRSVLDDAGLDIEEIDEVAYYEQPSVKFSRILTCTLASFPSGTVRFGRSMRCWLGERLWARSKICSHLQCPPRHIHLLPHHKSHMAQAFLSSPFDEAAILVVDGVGEWHCTTLATADRKRAEIFQIIEQYQYPNSIGLLYAAFTAYLGFEPNSGESNTMALAAYGLPRYVDEIRKIFGLRNDGTYEIDTKYFDFEGDDNGLYTPTLVDVFGSPRDLHRPYGFDALRDVQDDIDMEDRRCADIAASLQEVLAEALLGLIRRVRLHTESDNLCLAGGVALNCLANSCLLEKSGVRRLFIPPDPGDGGAAFGAATLRASDHGPVRPIEHPYLGSTVHMKDALDLLTADASGNFLLGKQRSGVRRAESVQWCVLDDEDELLDNVTSALAKGRIVAWMQGRFELGPRALGNRSLLVDPSNSEAVRRLSSNIKSHARFRPYALSIAGEDAPRVLDTEWMSQPVLRWMQTIWTVRPEFRDRLRGAIHADGTTRPQVCWREENPRYWALLRRWAQHSGIAALLNTSLNEQSMPISGSAYGGLAIFARTAIDTLVVDNLILQKNY